MIQDFFDIKEVVCPEVFHKYGQTAWSFFDSRLLVTMESLRIRLNKQIFINNWDIKGQFSQRGFRCIQCSLVQDAVKNNVLYCSAHMTGQAYDFDVEGLVAEEVRQYIIKNANLWPYPIRLESDTSWCHLDTRGGISKVTLFNS